VCLYNETRPTAINDFGTFDLNQVAPVTIHPAHEKAAHYFGVRIVHVAVGRDGRPDMVKYDQVRNVLLLFFMCDSLSGMCPWSTARASNV
jgi:glutamate/tyrosine decarboxylase-like PLP-dependent enzyme